jgi:hypothetical protein
VSSSFRPSDIYGPPGPRRPPPPRDDALPAAPSRSRWPLVAGLVVVVIVGGALLAAPNDVGEGGIPPAVVDVVSEDQAIAALALYRSQAEAQQALGVERSIFAPPGPSVLIRAAEESAADVRARLAAARSTPDADATVRSYWMAGEHDQLAERLEGAVLAIREINLLAATHDTIFDGAGQVSLPEAEQELTSRYLTGTPDGASPLAEWGRALLAELDGVEDRRRAETARAATDAWWADLAAGLEPPAREPLRAYLGGLPESTLTGLEGHPLAGPGLAHLRAS